MVIVYSVTRPGTEPTRLHLPDSAWGKAVIGRLLEYGYAVQATHQPREPDLRGKAELARRDELLEWAAPD